MYLSEMLCISDMLTPPPCPVCTSAGHSINTLIYTSILHTTDVVAEERTAVFRCAM